MSDLLGYLEMFAASLSPTTKTGYMERTLHQSLKELAVLQIH
jgi:hypothetical protein